MIDRMSIPFINAKLSERDGLWFVEATTGQLGGGHKFGPLFHSDAIHLFDDMAAGRVRCGCENGRPSVAHADGRCAIRLPAPE